MQIEILTPAQGEALPAIKWNYDELKASLSAALESYKGRVYTDDAIGEAKKDRANLNKLAAAIDGKRKEMKALYLHPYEEFEAQAKELVAMVKDASAEIDAQVKTFEEFRKQEKKAQIIELYNAMIGNLAVLVPYDRLHDPKWLNVTTSMPQISEELAGKIGNVESGISAIDSLEIDADIAQQIKDVFLKKFDLAAALSEGDRLKKQREELNRYKAAQDAAQSAQASRGINTPESISEPLCANGNGKDGGFADSAERECDLITLAFRVWATKEQLSALKGFLKTNNIRYGRA